MSTRALSQLLWDAAHTSLCGPLSLRPVSASLLSLVSESQPKMRVKVQKSGAVGRGVMTPLVQSFPWAKTALDRDDCGEETAFSESRHNRDVPRVFVDLDPATGFAKLGRLDAFDCALEYLQSIPLQPECNSLDNSPLQSLQRNA